MQTTKIITTIFLACLCMLTGCISLPQSQSLDLAVCGSYAVPGMHCSDLKGGRFDCEVLDTDSQGRILFLYTTLNTITDKEETVLIICQIAGSKHVYFYEDICYFMGEPSEDEIGNLKKQNDWDCDLDFSKMTRRANNISFDLFLMDEDELDYRKVRAACCRAFEIEESQIKDLYILDYNENKQVMYILELEKDDVSERYCVLVNEFYEVAYMSISDADTFYSDIAGFKQESGWNSKIEVDDLP